MKKDVKALIEKGKALIKKGEENKAFKIFNSLIDENNMEVHYALGDLYSMSVYRRDVLSKMFNRYAHGDPEYPIKESDKHYKKAFELAKKNKEDPIAQRLLGDMHKRGVIVKKNFKESFTTRRDFDGRLLVKINFRQAFNWYKKAADNGDAQAQNELGDLYNRGLVASREDILAFEKFKKAAKQGDIEAQFNLGQMYREGIFTIRDYEEALRWIKKSAEQGYAPAQTALGDIKSYGEDEEKKEAFSWYKKAAKQGFAPAQYHLGTMYAGREDSFYFEERTDYQEALMWLKKAAEQGEGRWYLTRMYTEGRGIVQDFQESLKSEPKYQNVTDISQWRYGRKNEQEAFKWFKKAAEQGINSKTQEQIEAEYIMDLLLSPEKYRKRLKMTAQDRQELIKRVEKAIAMGYVGAQYTLAQVYYKGEVVPQNFKKAFAMFEEIVKDPDFHVRALYFLGRMFFRGEGVRRNYKEAFKIFKERADKGGRDDCVKVGAMYLMGRGTKKDYKEALKWLEKERFSPLGKYYLGLMFALGAGIRQDFRRALVFYQEAAPVSYRDGWEKELFEDICRDYQSAFGKIKKIADQADEEAQTYLGVIYLDGIVVKKDEKKAFGFLKKAAEKDYPAAQYYLGCLYRERRDYQKALGMFKKAADNGFYLALVRLGEMSLNGEN